MIKEGKFGVQETTCLLTLIMCDKLFFSSPAFLTRLVGTAVWYTTLISNITAIFAFIFIYLLLKRFPGKNIVEIFDLSMGRFFGFLFSFAFMMFFLYNASLILREFTDSLKVYMYIDTPSSIIEIFFIIAVVIAAYLGLESIIRISRLFGYGFLFGLILVLILSLQNVNYRYLFPFWGNGLHQTIIHGVRRSSAYSEIVAITVFAGSLHNIRDIKKAGFTSLILSGVIFTTVLLFFIMIFPYSILQELTSPMYAMIRAIKHGNFLQRIDPFFLFVWNAITLITISILFYCAVSIYCKIFRLQDSNPIIIPMAVLLLVLTMAPKDYASVVSGSVQSLRENGWMIAYGLPFIALITAIIRRKEGGKPHV